MNTPHMHAAVLRAIADGMEVQYKPHTQANWRDVASNTLEHNQDPISFPHYEWRIKPEPKPDVVRYVNAYLCDGHRTIETAKKAQSEDIAGRVKIVIDGETGKLKSAEVLP